MVYFCIFDEEANQRFKDIFHCIFAFHYIPSSGSMEYYMTVLISQSDYDFSFFEIGFIMFQNESAILGNVIVNLKNPCILLNDRSSYSPKTNTVNQ